MYCFVKSPINYGRFAYSDAGGGPIVSPGKSVSGVSIEKHSTKTHLSASTPLVAYEPARIWGLPRFWCFPEAETPDSLR